jgi:MFS superfamily sulfate permease-like transporter
MDHVHDTIAERVRAATSPCKLVVLDLSAAPYVDMHAAHMLADLAEELTAAGIRVQAVEARSSVRERLRNEGVDEKLGMANRFASVADAVDDFELEFPTSYLAP